MTESESLRELYARDEISLLAYERASAWLIYFELEDAPAGGLRPHSFEHSDGVAGWAGLRTVPGRFAPSVT